MSIKLFNLTTNKYDKEDVCAEGFMRFLYETPLGKAAVWTLFKRKFFSRLCGAWADSKISKKAVAKFVSDNSLDMSDFIYDAQNYPTFNAFFTRALAPNKRPLADCDVSFPSDGRHLLIKNVSENDTFYVKGVSFDLAKFLGDAKLAARFAGGDMLISRLCPTDYHRFHYPISGEIVARKSINGALFSVSPIALAPRISIFWENKRILNMIDSSDFGLCAFVEIGATNVGTIVNFDDVGKKAVRGECAGMFKFGGSCVITLFPPSAKIKWDAKLVEISAQSVECYARANTIAGVIEAS